MILSNIFKFELKLFLLFIMMADGQYFTFYVSIPLHVPVYHHKSLIRASDNGSHLMMIAMKAMMTMLVVVIYVWLMMMMVMLILILETRV